VRAVQDILGRRILLENVSSYVTFRDSRLTEWEFLREVAVQADCLILLDVNNIYVSAVNRGADPGSQLRDYLERLPGHCIGEIHLAGLKQLPKGKVLEAWVEREGKVEPVPALFAPDKAGDASTTIDDMEDVSIVMVTREPEGGSKTPSEKDPFVQVPLET